MAYGFSQLLSTSPRPGSAVSLRGACGRIGKGWVENISRLCDGSSNIRASHQPNQPLRRKCAENSEHGRALAEQPAQLHFSWVYTAAWAERHQPSSSPSPHILLGRAHACRRTKTRPIKWQISQTCSRFELFTCTCGVGPDARVERCLSCWQGCFDATHPHWTAIDS